MASIGFPELIIIFLLLLVLFGAKKIPQLARAVGQSIGEFKKARVKLDDEIAITKAEIREIASPPAHTRR